MSRIPALYRTGTFAFGSSNQLDEMDSDLLPTYLVGVAIAGIVLLVVGVYLTARGIRFVAGRMRRPSTAWCAGFLIAGAAALVFLTIMRYLLEF